MKHVICGAIVAGMAFGCASNGPSSRAKETPTGLAAYAGGVEFPTKFKPYLEPTLTATVNMRSGMITLRNFGNAGVSEPRIWINGIFVYRVPALNAQTTLRLSKQNFYDSSGRSLKDLPTSAIKKIQLETAQGLMDVQGPMAE